ncbi:hypothetical protein, partial [Caldisalinibacter kiritimatiensis]|uniref:hypothetical protein n=1 Tax=Caldisalinibacter kiritimatiensis TaxID=1304284 RepID=UPI000550FC58
MKKKEILIITLISIIVASIVFNIYQYKENIETKIEYGDVVSSIETYALRLVPSKVLSYISDRDNIDEIVLAKTIEYIITARYFASIEGVDFPQVVHFLDNTLEDLEKLNKLIKQNEKKEEIDILIQKIKNNQEKSLKTYEEIEK